MDTLNAVKHVVMSARPQARAQGPNSPATEVAQAIPMCAGSCWIVKIRLVAVKM